MANWSKSIYYPENRAGFSSNASEDITPSHPVYSRDFYTSSYV
jgi:hypothetical protein